MTSLMMVFGSYQKANFMLAIIKKRIENKLTNKVCLYTVHSVYGILYSSGDNEGEMLQLQKK